MIIRKNKVFNKKNIVIASIVLLFLITIVLVNVYKGLVENKKIEQEQQRVKQYTALTDFKTIQEVALYLDSTFLKQEASEIKNINYNIYMKIGKKPYENGKENQVFYEKLIQYSAYVLKYKNFVIIDEENQLIITVICNETAEMVSTYSINGELNYFENIQNKENIQNVEQIAEINLSIDSDDLKNIVNNMWKTDNINIGTVESTYRDYDVYFDEGIQIRKINKKVFNIIFNKKYTKSIINSLKTTSTKQEIIDKLGTPQYETGNLIGYKSSDMYVFFYNNQISIYRNEKYETDKIAELVEQYVNSGDLKDFYNKLKDTWNDYDKYINSEENILLQYTLKGICIKFDSSNENGVIIYNNYKGKICGNLTLEDYKNGTNLPNEVHILNNDLVFKHEIERINTLDNTTMAYNYTTRATLNTSNSFKVIATEVGEKIYGIRFVSIGEKYPNLELREYISIGIWLNDFEFVYSVQGKGIYKFNLKDCSYKTIVTGKDNFKIKYIENNILYYDETLITL